MDTAQIKKLDLEIADLRQRKAVLEERIADLRAVRDEVDAQLRQRRRWRNQRAKGVTRCDTPSLDCLA